MPINQEPCVLLQIHVSNLSLYIKYIWNIWCHFKIISMFFCVFFQNQLIGIIKTASFNDSMASQIIAAAKIKMASSFKIVMVITITTIVNFKMASYKLKMARYKIMIMLSCHKWMSRITTVYASPAVLLSITAVYHMSRDTTTSLWNRSVTSMMDPDQELIDLF